MMFFTFRFQSVSIRSEEWIFLKGSSSDIYQDEYCYNIDACQKIIIPSPGNDGRLVVENALAMTWLSMKIKNKTID